MYIFAGTKIFKESGAFCVYSKYYPKLQIVHKECFRLFFNDNTSIIVPSGSQLLLDNGEKFLISESTKFYKKIRETKIVKTTQVDFQNDCYDPMLVGIVLFAKYKDCKFVINNKKISLILKDIETDYYNIGLNEGQKYTEIKTSPDYPNIFEQDMKKDGVTDRLSQRVIPERYLYSSKENRKKLLSGIVLTAKIKNGKIIVQTPSPNLAKDIATLVRSLGGFARISKHSCKNLFYKIFIAIDLSFIKEYDNLDYLKKFDKKIFKIEKVGIQPCVEIPTKSVIVDNFLKFS